MEIRTLAAVAAALAMGMAGPALAAKQSEKKVAKPVAEKTVVTAVDVPPPSGTWEAAPPPNADYVWSKGYHRWTDGHYEWTPGEWVRKKDGMTYRQRQWTQRADGKWVLTGGEWVPSSSVAGNR